MDNWAAVCAEIGAAQQLTAGAASRLLLVAVALRDRLPNIAALFTAGVIGYRLVATIVHRSALIKDPDALRAVDTALAHAVQLWGPLSLDKTDQAIDALITEFDPYALRRTQGNARSRTVEVYLDDASGIATLWASLFATDAKALDERLDTLAATTCDADPRTHDQRRADGLGALAHGQHRLACLCGNPECPAAETVPSTVVIHVVAHHDAVTTEPAPQAGPDGGSGADVVSCDAPAPATDDVGDLDTTPREPDTAECGGDSGVDEALGGASPDGALHASGHAAQHASLDGESPPMFSKPLREMTLAEVIRESNADPGEPFATRPGVIIGGPILPGPVLARTALTATIVPIIHPGNAPPEQRRTPSKALADFVRCRDLTCRFPGCPVPGTECDIDHTIPYPIGPTQASNLKCVCRNNHLLKTFWGGPGGWRDQQLPDGTVIWTAPGGQSYTTHPGSRLLFPSLCEPTAPVTVTAVPTAHTAGLTMPRRQSTRAQDRQHRIDDERRRNELDPPVEWARRNEPPPF
jgi:hypothetical protein